MTKPNTFQTLLVVWLMVSAVYISHDMWKNGVNATYQLGQQAGVQQAFANIIAQSQECQPFNIFVGDAKADLINVACLEAAAAQAQAQQEGAGAQVTPALQNNEQ